MNPVNKEQQEKLQTDTNRYYGQPSKISISIKVTTHLKIIV